MREVREAGLPPSGWKDWDGSPLPPSDVLRWGFSTGAAMCACLVESLRRRLGAAPAASIDVLFADSRTRTIPLMDPPAGRELSDGWVGVRKNGGDDLDCTHGAVLYGRMLPRKTNLPICPADMELRVGSARVLLHSVEGIGVARRGGLDCPKERWAINDGPRRMLCENLLRAGLETGEWCAEIGVLGGAALATRTLNPTLGVEGGISILGTTGLVRPFSAEAYAATVRVCMRSCRLAGTRTAILCTGGRTKKGAESWAAESLGELPEEAFISIGDFIGEALQAAQAEGLERIVVACMPGKLLKYTAGLTNTHAHKTAQDMPLLVRALEKILSEHDGTEGQLTLLSEVASCASVREALEKIPQDLHGDLLEDLMAKALQRLPELFRPSLRERVACHTASPENPRTAVLPALAILLTDFTGRPMAFRERTEEVVPDAGDSRQPHQAYHFSQRSQS